MSFSHEMHDLLLDCARGLFPSGLLEAPLMNESAFFLDESVLSPPPFPHYKRLPDFPSLSAPA